MGGYERTTGGSGRSGVEARHLDLLLSWYQRVIAYV